MNFNWINEFSNLSIFLENMVLYDMFRDIVIFLSVQTDNIIAH